MDALELGLQYRLILNLRPKSTHDTPDETGDAAKRLSLIIQGMWMES